MKDKALVVIDLQNDITKNYQKIIGQVNKAIDWAMSNDMHVVYIRHYNLSEKTRTFKNAEREFSAIYSRDESAVNALTFSNICLPSCRLRGIIGL